MRDPESRQVRRARQRREASAPRLRKPSPRGNRAERRAQRPADDQLIIRPISLSSPSSLERRRRDFRIRTKLRGPRGSLTFGHPTKASAPMSLGRLQARFVMAMIFAAASRRVQERRAAALG